MDRERAAAEVALFAPRFGGTKLVAAGEPFLLLDALEPEPDREGVSACACTCGVPDADAEPSFVFFDLLAVVPGAAAEPEGLALDLEGCLDLGAVGAEADVGVGVEAGTGVDVRVGVDYMHNSANNHAQKDHFSLTLCAAASFFFDPDPFTPLLVVPPVAGRVWVSFE